MPPGMEADSLSQASSSQPTPSSASKPKSAEEKAPPIEEIAADEPMEVDSEAEAKSEAEKLKAEGNVAYKARKFDEASAAYSKAWEVWPKDVAFLTNLSGTCSRVL